YHLGPTEAPAKRRYTESPSIGLSRGAAGAAPAGIWRLGWSSTSEVRRMDEESLREKARVVVRNGKLPRRRPDRTWGGPGVGAQCLRTVVRARVGGECDRDHRRPTIGALALAQLCDEREAIGAGHAEIAHEHVDGHILESGERVAHRGRCVHLRAAVGERDT